LKKPGVPRRNPKLPSRHRSAGAFIQVCNAIQHAPQKGIIHRDIKPSNVLVDIHDGRSGA
jgi:serine/threonine protein kinase